MTTEDVFLNWSCKNSIPDVVPLLATSITVFVVSEPAWTISLVPTEAVDTTFFVVSPIISPVADTIGPNKLVKKLVPSLK